MHVSLAARELDVMRVLWNSGSGTVAQVRAALADDLAYTTVLTVLQRLDEKGYVRREEEGRAHRYHPQVQQQAAQRSALGRLVGQLFRGSPELLLTELLSDRDLDESDLRRLRSLLDARLGETGR